jgi:hypothetical protein
MMFHAILDRLELAQDQLIYRDLEIENVNESQQQ